MWILFFNLKMFFYIHIPFCSSKCKYCSFASFSDISWELKNKYLKKLKEEIRDFFERNWKQEINSIYFWWWTPSLLLIKEIEEILGIFYKFWYIKNTEITLEANPENITREYIIWLEKLWINRISIWIQSLNNETLEKIWRAKKSQIINTLDILQKSQIDNISVDFIIWLPHATRWETKKNLEEIIVKYPKIKHISVYMLESWRYPENWKNISIQEDDYLEEYIEVVEFLENAGFFKYEISNFAKKWYTCKHNQSYWNHGNYRWFGLCAASFIDSKRFANSSNFLGYFANKLEYEENLNREDLELEKIMFNIRTFWIDKKLVRNEEKLKEFIDLNRLKKEKNIIHLTNKWTLLVDYILKEVFL